MDETYAPSTEESELKREESQAEHGDQDQPADNAMAAEASAEAGTDAQATVTPGESHETQVHDGREQSADNEHSSEPAPRTTAHEAGSPRSPATTQTNHSSSPGAAATTGASTGIGSETPQFVAPSDLLRLTSARAGSPFKLPSQHKKPMSAVDRDQIAGLRAIRAFLKVRTSYDVLPLSYRLIIFDTSLLVKKSLNILTQSQIVSAPLWDSKTSTFAGLLTTSDYLNVVQYYWQNPDALAQVDQFKLNSLREIERAIGVAPIETVSINPHKPLYEACRRMLESRARRIPLVDVDDETQREMVVSVVTQYRILKFVSVNVKETQWLKKPLRDLQHYGVGSYENLVTAHMDTPVMDVMHQLVKRSISSVPILDDKDGTVLNVFEAVDVILLIKGGDYESLNLTVGRALEKRSDDFPGIYTCTLNDRLETIFDTIRKSRVHRLIVIDEQNQLKGVLSLSDILDYTLNSPLGDEGEDGR